MLLETSTRVDDYFENILGIRSHHLVYFIKTSAGPDHGGDTDHDYGDLH